MITHGNCAAPRILRLAGGIAALLGVPAAATAAMTWSVTSCLDDGGAGTLRSIVSAASTLSGDTVDLSFCSNSTITLYAGDGGIAIAQNSLKIYGGNSGTVTIDASSLDPTTYSAFYHTGSGALTVRGLTISGGHVNRQGNALGGCLYSRTNVSLFLTTITGCTASSDGPALGGGVYAKGFVYGVASNVSSNTANGNGTTSGGGIFAKGGAFLRFSTVSGNSASAASGPARGGGVYGSDVTFHYSTVSGNHVAGPAAADGGGVFTKQSLVLRASTISGNTSGGRAGGAYVTQAFGMYNSTVSGNSAATKGGGLYLNFYSNFYNSTIAFNTATVGSPGVLLYAANQRKVTMQSTLMSNNTSGATDNDLTVVNPTFVTFNAGPANNLVRATKVTTLPGDTISGTCPLLGPLRDNGGLTRTHQLLSTSVAINAGNDVTIDPLSNPKVPFADDQRGPAVLNGTRDYPRVSGPQADIGAYEVQKGDIVFNAGFDGCNPLAP
jgi:hypothetical protein